MKVLITGNLGYIGPVLTRHLRGVFDDIKIIGYDAGLFAHCLTNVDIYVDGAPDVQYFGDVRAFPEELLDGVDAVVHLAAVSNDPMGKRFEVVTEAINHKASVAIASAAARAGVGHYVFASSCSVYGMASNAPRKEDDSLDPLTAYARSKVATEQDLATMDLNGMTVTCLRFATACGMSDRLRLDLVLNDFVAGATASGQITVLSDGSPWRPLIDVKDMARAIEWGITRPAELGGQCLRINAGAGFANYQIKDLAETVAAMLSNVTLSINTEAPPDKRSYQVDFSLFEELAPNHVPRVQLEQSVRELSEGLKDMLFNDPNFRESQFMRLKVLDKHIAGGRLSEQLYWGRPA